MSPALVPSDALSATFAALADPTRRAILTRLAAGEMNVTELAAPFEMTLPAVTKHLKVLERAGLISRGRQAQWRPCRLQAQPLREVADWAMQYHSFWDAPLARLDAYLHEVQVFQPRRNPMPTAPGSAFEAPRFHLQRRFKAPRDLVFQAWTQADHLARWWGPAGLAMLKCEIDLRPGGAFLYGMRAPDGREMWGKWIFLRVDAPRSLEFLASFCDPQGTPVRHPLAAEWPLEVLSTLTLTEEAGETLITLTGTPHNASERECAVFAGATGAMEQGWKGTLDKFEAYLAQEAA